ncbi:MAG: patatin-like phospholipase family protein [Candidatus Daviesbacteria bacterium]|nr:patatin-like phospholipase family protein [Candidatus Daviesbacteria bacterium]
MKENCFYSGVRKVVADRIVSGSNPDKRDDPYKLGLVVEGGAMRGVITGAQCAALQALNAFDVFDGIYSISAGSYAALYFASGNPEWGTSIYYDYLDDKKFVNFGSLLKGRDLLDIDYLVDVTKTAVVLNRDKVTERAFLLKNYILSANDGEMHEVSPVNDGRIDLILNCAPRMALLTTPVRANGRSFLDGAVVEGSLALNQAIADECTHVLVLLSKPEGQQFKSPRMSDWFTYQLLKRKFPELADKCRYSGENYNKILHKLYLSQNDLNYHPRIDSVSIPGSKKTISRWETRRNILLQGAKDGFESVMDAFYPYRLPINPEVKIVE